LAVLAVLGRTRVRLRAEHLLAHEGREDRLDLGIGAFEREPEQDKPETSATLWTPGSKEPA
jgi:hypothetical protein